MKLILSIIATLSFAFGADDSELKTSCEMRMKSSKVKAEYHAVFCKCWVRDMKKIEAADLPDLKLWVSKKISLRQFENKNPPLAEYVMKIEEACLEENKITIKIDPTSARKQLTPTPVDH